MVVETMKKGHLSIYAAMQEFGINDHKIIERWERIYLEEGPVRLSPDHGRTSQTQFPPEPQDCPAAYERVGLSLPCQDEEVPLL